MPKTQKHRWIVDAVLFTGFIFSFLLDFTGLPLHQWLGVGVFALMGYHLLEHDTWVTSVTSRFFGKLAARSRLYYLLDAALLVGFAAITFTGLVISTWLNLELDNPDTWLVAHIAASIITLLVTIAKLALHWRWIALVAKNIFSGQPVMPQRPAGGAVVGRREFLGMMGVVGISSAIALASSIHALPASTEPELNTADAENSTTGSSSKDTASLSSSGCSVRCQKRCSYPGHCRKYVDSNHNGRCDLGECA